MTRSPEQAQYTIAVDTGGTFTDLVLANQNEVIGLFKALTTKQDLLEGISNALSSAAMSLELSVQELLGKTGIFVYSTTHSTNALLEGKIARTAFLTTRGHPDILLYKEGGKDQVHNWAMPFPEPYVPRRFTFEITERVNSDGEVLIELDAEELDTTIERLAELHVEAVGVCLLWSVANPDHELEIARRIRNRLPRVEISLSHQVNGIIREYRRASATVIDASLKPLMRSHLSDMDRRLRKLGFCGEPLMVTHVSGGVMHLDQMVERPIQTIDSGPALAPVAGRVFANAELSNACGDLIVVDTGGTSFDASLVINGQIAYTREKWFGPRWTGHMTGLPAVDTRSIGAGGGSIAYVDAGGLMHVGPESAGAIPGPAAYGKGGKEPTVTDAAVVLGHLDPAEFLGGEMVLDPAAAHRAVREYLAGPLGTTVEAAAESVMTIASEAMRGLLGDLTVSQGRDARECAMVAGGGAAGLNIARIAREAGIRQVLVPRMAAGLSAVGGLYSDIIGVFSRGHYTLTSSFDFEGVATTLSILKDDMNRFLTEIDHPGETCVRYLCEARYEQQMWEIELDLGSSPNLAQQADLDTLCQAFNAKHLDLFATQQEDSHLELISWRSEARVIRQKPLLVPETAGEPSGNEPALPSGQKRFGWFENERVLMSVFSGTELHPGMRVVGPAIISEPTTTLVLIPGCTAEVRASCYVIDV